MALHIRNGGLRVCGSCKTVCSPQGRCQDFDEYFSINRLPLSALAFVLQANPSDCEEILGRHLPQVIIEVMVTQQPSTLLRRLFSGLLNKTQQLKAALATTKAMWVTESRGGMKVLRDQLTGLM